MRAALDILALSQDAEAIDALFSIRPDLLDKLLGMEYAVVSVQVADSLIALALAGCRFGTPAPPRFAADFVFGAAPRRSSGQDL